MRDQATENDSTRDGYWGGSGVLVTKGPRTAICLTNEHVVRKSTGTGKVMFPSGAVYVCRVILRDHTNDLAALLIDTPSGIQPIKIRQTAPVVGDRLIVAGYGKGNEPFRAMAGLYTRDSTNKQGSAEWFKISAPVRKGDSGGPVLDATTGALCGILWAGDKYAPNTTAVKLVCVKRFIRRVRERFDTGSNQNHLSVNGSMDVDRWGTRIAGQSIPESPRFRITVPRPGTRGELIPDSPVRPPPELIAIRASLADIEVLVRGVEAEVRGVKSDLDILRREQELGRAAAPAEGPPGATGQVGPSVAEGPQGPAGDSPDLSLLAAIAERLESLEAAVREPRELDDEQIAQIVKAVQATANVSGKLSLQVQPKARQ